MIISKLNLPLDVKHQYWTDNWKNLRDYILLSLGYPIIRVELTEMHLNIAIRNALTCWLNYEAIDIYSMYTTYDNEGFVQVPVGVNMEIGFVHDVIFEGSNFYGFFGSSIPVENQYLGINQPFLLADFDLVYYTQQRAKLEDMNQLLNLQRTWDIVDSKIRVYPTSRNVPSKNICVLYCPVPMPELIEQDSWIQEMSVAEAKILLGTIRGKFSSYSFGGGGTQTDGEQIKGDGKEAKQALLEDIKSRRRPLPMVQF